ncbi:hypothetical protein CQW23_19458 [Capsicum baccatum]|uniref:Retrovirus-related Pol polyprotein from transposon TNT 1-94-like beta-barrel domain-containing protein n=1 Tax=Capsicum baccatum TaxID=33114 RepID=A0A2G2W5W5_CAPBA|nr:hypothetical protein CQW23_19458 [Capsicum baccatum]
MDVLYTIFTCTRTLSVITFTSFLVLILRIYADKSIRNPKYAPVVGTVLHQLFYFKRLYDYQTKIAKKLPTSRFLSPGESIICTTDPRNVEHILKTKFGKYSKGKRNQEIIMDLFGEGIFAVDGDKWKQQRKLASLEFSARVLRDFSCTVFRKRAVKLVRKVFQFSISNQVFDVQELLMRCSLDSIFKVGFGVDLNCLDRSGRDDNNFIKAFDDSNELIYWCYADSFWKLKRYFNIGSEALLKKNIKFMHKFVDELIKTRQSKKDPEKMTDQYLTDIILNFVLAGKDTTANTLSWFFYMLCKNPLIQEKVVAKITEVTGNNIRDEEHLEDFVASITEGILEKMHYLHAALTETLRLYSAVPLDGRCADADDVLPDGFHFRKGDDVNYISYAMGRMPYIWSNDAEDFRPERWLKDGIFQPESPFKFIAFHERCDDMVTSWLLNSLSKDLADSLQYVNNAQELWQALEDRYDQTNGAKLYQLQKEINYLSQGTLDITGYYTKMKQFWEELGTIDASASCSYFKFSKGKNTASAVNTHITSGNSSDGKLTSTHGHGGDIPVSHNLTQDQYNQLMQLLKNFSVVDTAGHDPNRFIGGAVNLAGILACHSSMTEIGNLSCSCKTLSTNSWILDSGASHYMTYKKDLMTNIAILPYPGLVSLPNGYKVKVTEVGDVHLGSTLTLCRAPSLKRPLVIGKASDGLYYFCTNHHKTSSSSPSSIYPSLQVLVNSMCDNSPEKIAQEIKETTTEKKYATDITNFSANVSEETLEKMQRFHTALTETLRLHAIVRLDEMYAFQDDTLPVGFNVRKGDMVCYLPYAKGRTKFIRGDDEEEYKPERWLDGDGFFTLQARKPLQFQHSSLQFTNNQHASEKLHFDGNEKMHYVHATLTETLKL